MSNCVRANLSPDLRKPSMYTQQVKCILLLNIIDTLIYYWQDNKRWPGLLFHMAFLGHANHWKASTDGEGPLGGFNRMAWTQIISYTLAMSSVVVCGWCGGLFGIWLQLGVPLVFSNWSPVNTLPPPPPPTLYKCHSWYYSRASKSLPNQAGKTISDD